MSDLDLYDSTPDVQAIAVRELARDAEAMERLAGRLAKALARVLHVVPLPPRPAKAATCICPVCEAQRVLDEAREMGVGR